VTIIASFDGENDFLSNFFTCSIEHEGIWYTSTEAAFQAAKTLDMDERQKIARMNPGKAKRAGKKVALRPDWETIKLSVMEDLVRQKFVRHNDLKEKLLATGDATLIEGNWWKDTFWGVSGGVGENHLGKILMKVRNELHEDKITTKSD
jgi:ribA/ribD-fused uncharacterized protein